MRRRWTTYSVALALSASLAAGGCRSAGAQKAEAGAPRAVAAPASPLAVGPELRQSEEPIRGGGARPVAIKEGLAPLFYLSDVTATLRVVDRTAGDLILAEGVVGPRTIVRVDTRTGIVFGRDRQLAGPLPEGRRYAILVVPDGANVWRFGSARPTPASRRRDATPAELTGPVDVGADADADGAVDKTDASEDAAAE
jgi:hypothetical protein